jgi:hypothetical protein
VEVECQSRAGGRWQRSASLLCVAFRSGAARHPLGWLIVTMVHGEEHKFDASRNSQLLKNPEQVCFDGVLSQPKLDGDLAIAHAVSYQCDDLLFTRGEEMLAIDAKHSQRRHGYHRFKKVQQLSGVCPNLQPELHECTCINREIYCL